ncbi:hypothetical protein QPK87_13135 [Kamptonema cortianum]|nr:hypothetical protein [Kamptonema cortianum]
MPHFEKMLYDNALLSRLYLEAWLLTGDTFYKDVCVDILEYVLREMTSPEGGFYSTQDADSEGVEGKFFVWSKQEFDSVIGHEDAALAAEYFDISAGGNWEHANIPNLRKLPAQFAREHGIDPGQFARKAKEWRCKLFGAREKRIKPGRDEKNPHRMEWHDDVEFCPGGAFARGTPLHRGRAEKCGIHPGQFARAGHRAVVEESQGRTLDIECLSGGLRAGH